jgi:hypothetical protein
MAVPPTPPRLSKIRDLHRRRLSLFFTPYSPELNPDEWVWKNVKHDAVRRAVAMSKGHLYGIAYDALRRIQNTASHQRVLHRPRLAYIAGKL